MTIEDLDLEPKQEFMYLFDNGDEWRFKVRVHAVHPDAPEGDYPRIVESVGEAPEQYSSWDWERALSGPPQREQAGNSSLYMVRLLGCNSFGVLIGTSCLEFVPMIPLFCHFLTGLLLRYCL
jgi:hypothetical protein